MQRSSLRFLSHSTYLNTVDINCHDAGETQDQAFIKKNAALRIKDGSKVAPNSPRESVGIEKPTKIYLPDKAVSWPCSKPESKPLKNEEDAAGSQFHDFAEMLT